MDRPRAVEFPSFEAAERAATPDEVAVTVRFPDGSVQYGVLPKMWDGRGGPETIAGYWQFVRREAARS